jgi:hypothetical protein
MNDPFVGEHTDVQHVLDEITDPVVRHLVDMAIAAAVVEVAQVGDDKVLPAAPFDLVFFARVVATAFRRTDIVRKVLDGQTPAEASGWDM